MIVVQLFAADPHAPRGEIGGGVAGLEIPIAPPVAQAIDHARGPERDPRHLDRPHRHAHESEQRKADEQQQRGAGQRMTGIDVAFDPIVRRALAVLLDRDAIAAGFPIQLDAAPKYRTDAFDHRAVRIFFSLAFRMVFAMDRDPLLGDHRSGEPDPQAEKVRDDRVEIDTAVRLAAVQIKRHREDGDLGHDQQIDQQRAPAHLQQAASEKIDQGRKHGGGARIGQPDHGVSR